MILSHGHAGTVFVPISGRSGYNSDVKRAVRMVAGKEHTGERLPPQDKKGTKQQATARFRFHRIQEDRVHLHVVHCR